MVIAGVWYLVVLWRAFAGLMGLVVCVLLGRFGWFIDYCVIVVAGVGVWFVGFSCCGCAGVNSVVVYVAHILL